MFTVVDAVLLAPLPYGRPNQIVVLSETYLPLRAGMSVAHGNFLEWRSRSRTLSALTAIDMRQQNLTRDGEPQQVSVGAVSDGFMTTAGVQPALGRWFTAEEFQPGREAVALLGHALWRTRYNRDSEVIGRTLTLDDRPYEIVGVMPAGFVFPTTQSELWTPLVFTARDRENRTGHTLSAMGRMRDGMTIDAARREMDAIATTLQKEFPASNRDCGISVKPARDAIVGDTKPVLAAIAIAVLLLLLVACANIAGLMLTHGASRLRVIRQLLSESVLLARAVSRQKEIAVRTAIGAGRRRIVQQLIVESIVLACLGGAAGLLVASWGVSLLMNVMATGLPRAALVNVDWRVLGFALAVSIATGIAYGLVPAIQVTRLDIREALNEESRGGGSGGVRHQRMRSSLVVAEIALALMLLVGAGLLLRSFVRLQNVAPGFDDPMAVANSVRAALREIDPDQPLVKVRSMEQAISDTVAQPRLQTMLLAVFAGVAVALALIGVYGVMAYTVSQRTQEIGVRVALGASGADVVRLVVGEAARLAFAGIALGLAGAAAVSQLLRTVLFDAGGLDPLAFVVAPIVLAIAALVAAWLPARRASNVPPIVALGR